MQNKRQVSAVNETPQWVNLEPFISKSTPPTLKTASNSESARKIGAWDPRVGHFGALDLEKLASQSGNDLKFGISVKNPARELLRNSPPTTPIPTTPVRMRQFVGYLPENTLSTRRLGDSFLALRGRVSDGLCSAARGAAPPLNPPDLRLC